MCDYINIPNKPNMKELNQKLAIIQTKLKAKKSSYNSFGKYYFRKSEDILIHATALVGVDLNQKGMQTSQQFGAASTYGKKYALGNLLLIDDTEDSDATNNHGSAPAVQKIKQAANQVITADQMSKAVEYISAGGDIEAIKSKYKLTAAQEKQLNGQKSNTTKA
jgi:hypothetical protein